MQGEEKRRRNSSKGRGGKKNKTNKQTNKQTKAEVQERELTKRREVYGFSEGLFFLRGYVLNCEIERKRHPRGHAIEPQAEESPGNEEITGGEERRILGQAATTTTKNNAANLIIILDSCLRAASNQSGYV